LDGLWLEIVEGREGLHRPARIPILIMNWEIGFVLLLMAGTFGIMVSERLRPDLVAMLSLATLILSGILTTAEGFSVFSNDAVITVGCMFVLSAALDRTGMLDWLGHRLDRVMGRSETSLLAVLLPFVVVLSAFVNNTPVVVVFMPIVPASRRWACSS
jgi:di/tricarboxylate transporter